MAVTMPARCVTSLLMIHDSVCNYRTVATERPRNRRFWSIACRDSFAMVDVYRLGFIMVCVQTSMRCLEIHVTTAFLLLWLASEKFTDDTRKKMRMNISQQLRPGFQRSQISWVVFDLKAPTIKRFWKGMRGCTWFYTLSCT